MHGIRSTTVMDRDMAYYYGAKPRIHLKKETTDGTRTGDGLYIRRGRNIGWVYTVTNGGNVALSSVKVTDNKVSSSNIRYQSGDVNRNSRLDVGETWVYRAHGTAIHGKYENTGTVTATFSGRTVSASDKSWYQGTS
jgi:hypothetical protein